MRKRVLVRAISMFFGLSLILSVLALRAAPAGAYYLERGGYVGLGYGGSSTQGIFMQLWVMPWRSVQGYGAFENGSSGWQTGFTNWTNYFCDGSQHPGGCTYNIVIPARGAPWHPLGCYFLHTDYIEGLHALIMQCSTWNSGYAYRPGGFDTAQTYWDEDD